MWYENNILIAVISFTIVAVLLLVLSAIPGFNLSQGAEKIIEMIITAIAAFVTGYVAKTIQGAITTKSITTTEKSSNENTLPEMAKIEGDSKVEAPTPQTFGEVINQLKKG